MIANVPTAGACLARLAAFSFLAVVLSSGQTLSPPPSSATGDGIVPLPVSHGSDEGSVATCPENQCLGRAKSALRPDPGGVINFGCFCDEKCAEYGDCCRDAPWPAAAPEEFTCSYLGGSHLYILSRCPDPWPHDATRRSCESEDVSLSGDPLAVLPVTSLRSGRTYRNAACARCHSDTDGAVLWDARLDFLRPRLSAEVNITVDTLRQNEHGQWGVTVLADGVETFSECRLDLRLPKRLGFEHLRPCLPAVSNCAPNWTEVETAAQCGAYTSRVLDMSKSSERGRQYSHVYRNPHCALCNGLTLDTLVCGIFSNSNGLEVRFSSDHSGSGTSLPFSILLDISDRSGSDTVGVVTVCDQGRYWDPFFHKCRHVFCDNGYILRNDSCVPDDSASSNSSSIESSTFQLCPKFYLSVDEFENRSDGSVYVKLYDQLYAVGEFELRDGELAVCSKSGDLSKFDEIMGILSLVFVVMSIICLCCHLVIFCVVPEQRNLPGKNLAALCTSLLVGYVCFLAAPFQKRDTEGCRALGIIMYAAFIASFLWMSVMAFDVFISLRRATTELRVASGDRLKRFVVFLLYALGSTVGLVLAAIVTDSSQQAPAAYRPGFGDRVCWFSRRRALLVFFALPLMVIMTANVVLFVGSALIVRRAAQSAADATCRPSKTNLKLYCRLAVITGLSWVVGLAAGWADFLPLWHVFVVLNTLQGVFIFCSFTMSRRVRSQMSRLARWKTTDGTGTGTGNDAPPTPATGETQI